MKRAFVVLCLKRDTWIGHLLRLECLLKTTIEGTSKDVNTKGRPRLKYIEDTGCPSYVVMKGLSFKRVLTNFKVLKNINEFLVLTLPVSHFSCLFGYVS